MGWGILGAAAIARTALIPAIAASRNGRLVAVASRDRERAEALARPAGAQAASYEALLKNPEVDAVYIPLVNSLHAEWSVLALEAGKHVLCEKPLAMTAAEAETMAAAAGRSGKLLMEGFMYRFDPGFRDQLGDLAGHSIRHVSAWFGFRVQDPDNYRLRPEYGGGALMDVGAYGINACRWLLGEPEEVAAVAHVGPTGVDLTTGASMRFKDGATAYVWASFESPEHQALDIDMGERAIRIERPFTRWHEPDDPYQVMVEEFCDAALNGRPAPLPISDSVANMRVIDRVRAAARPPS